MFRRMILGSVVTVWLIAVPGLGHAAVHVNIGINLPAPPQLVPVPGTPVSYAPGVPANYFFYGRQYYVFVNGAWYVSPAYNGPWAVVAPGYLPRPILGVPVQYYHVRPHGWEHWPRKAPPRWDAKWGRRWTAEHRAAPRHDYRETPRGEHRPAGREERRDERRDERR